MPGARSGGLASRPPRGLTCSDRGGTLWGVSGEAPPIPVIEPEVIVNAKDPRKRANGQWLPGLAPGRVKGVPNKMSVDLRHMIVTALSKAGGADYLLQQSRENPVAFMALVARILPREATLDVAVRVTLAQLVEASRISETST